VIFRNSVCLLFVFLIFFPLSVSAQGNFTFQQCGYDDSQFFVNYKEKGTAHRLFGLFSRSDWEDDFDSFVSREYRYLQSKDDRRGLYVNKAYAGDDREDDMLMEIDRVGVNFVVFDVDKVELLNDVQKVMRIRSFIEKLHERGIFSVARLVVGIDNETVKERPDWGIHFSDGRVWTDKKGFQWLDFTDREVVTYIGDLAEMVADLGVDEVQLDYIRFPTEGYIYSMSFDHDYPVTHRWDVIREVVREVRRRLIPRGVFLGVDFLGIVGWNNQYDAGGTGQSISCLSPYVDAIYPMAYPSHFGFGFDNVWNPADNPKHFISKTTRFFMEFSEGTFTDIRTWLQAFDYRVSLPYNSGYISAQIDGVREVQADGFVVWNASNYYGIVWPAILELRRQDDEVRQSSLKNKFSRVIREDASDFFDPEG
jgi:hypothetical protein